MRPRAAESPGLFRAGQLNRIRIGLVWIPFQRPHLVVGPQAGADAVCQRIVEIADLSEAPALPSSSRGRAVMRSLLLVAVGAGAMVTRPVRSPEGIRARRP